MSEAVTTLYRVAREWCGEPPSVERRDFLVAIGGSVREIQRPGAIYPAACWRCLRDAQFAGWWPTEREAIADGREVAALSLAQAQAWLARIDALAKAAT